MTTFTHTGSIQQYVVPAGVYLLDVTLKGASGAAGYNANAGRGGVVTGKLAVTPGEILRINVGGVPGGATDIRRGGATLLDRIAVAAGGGTAGGAWILPASGYGGTGGNAGHPAGADGTTDNTGTTTPGTGATQTAGGVANGSFGVAGSGTNGGGPGGGGLYGGGGGQRVAYADANAPGGGGGSSYFGALTNAAHVLGPVTTGGVTYDGEATLTPLNSPPSAPALTSMASSEAVDLHVTNRATHVHSDLNGDPQAAFDLRTRLVGDTTWTTVNVVTTSQWYDYPADSLAAGLYERQVRTYDTAGAGPWSPSGYFTAAEAPGAPTVTAPADGETIIEQHTAVDWSTPDQDSYQVRRLGDDAGVPDTEVVYFDTGEIPTAATRTLLLDFETNHRTEHVQVRVKKTALWSPWTSVRVDVDYDTPPTPTYTTSVDATTGTLLIAVTNPAPGTGELEADHNDIYIDDGDLVSSSGEERKVTGVAVNGTWRYWTPVSGRDYTGAIRVVAVAANGTTASST